MTFTKGYSGNPNGRPKGSKNRQKIYEEAIENHQEDLLAKAIELAKAGNESMLKLFLERMLPAKPKDQAIKFDMPENLSSADCAADIIQKLGNGELTPFEAKQSLDVLSRWCELVEVKELKDKVDQLSQNIGSLHEK